jgi:hypothetical protein
MRRSPPCRAQIVIGADDVAAELLSAARSSEVEQGHSGANLDAALAATGMGVERIEVPRRRPRPLGDPASVEAFLGHVPRSYLELSPR